MGGDSANYDKLTVRIKFQSTPPVWVVTVSYCIVFIIPKKFQSTPPVWVVTFIWYVSDILKTISIHTTRVGGDWGDRMYARIIVNISIHTTRVGGDNTNTCFYQFKNNISIHTTRVGGDSIIYIYPIWEVNFNPHHPCGWWPRQSYARYKKQIFQSTPPVWVVTGEKITIKIDDKISIHTTRVGGDQVQSLFFPFQDGFQSTPPVWVVTSTLSGNIISLRISIHTTRVGGDFYTS